LVYTPASDPLGWPFAVWAAMLNVGMVGDGRLGSAPLTGWADPVPATDKPSYACWPFKAHLIDTRHT